MSRPGAYFCRNENQIQNHRISNQHRLASRVPKASSLDSFWSAAPASLTPHPPDAKNEHVSFFFPAIFVPVPDLGTPTERAPEASRGERGRDPAVAPLARLGYLWTISIMRILFGAGTPPLHFWPVSAIFVNHLNYETLVYSPDTAFHKTPKNLGLLIKHIYEAG
jgi:hypothetical protein